MPESEERNKALEAASQAVQARRFWANVQRRIRSEIDRAMPHSNIEVDSIQFPLTVPVVVPGPIGTVIVDFPCRVIEWTIASINGGVITVDIQRSKPVTHPAMDSLPGGADQYPALDGPYAHVEDLSGWDNVTLDRGDMLHCFVLSGSAVEWIDGTLALKVRRIA